MYCKPYNQLTGNSANEVREFGNNEHLQPPISPCSLQMKYESSETPHGLKVIDLVFFFIVFMFRGAPRSCFSDFSSFGTPRKIVFRNFEASGLPKSVFFKILRLRDSPTVHFHKKQLVGASRNIVFLNFYLSGCPEAQFFPFFARRLQAKCCFWQFLMKNHKRRAVFVVFRSSLASEMLFSAISNEKPQATGCFPVFRSSFASETLFSMKNHKRRAVFIVFRISFTSDEFIHYFRGSQSFPLPFLHPRNECAGGERVLSYHCTYK